MTERILVEIGLILESAESFELEIEAILQRDDPKLHASTIKSLQEIDFLSQSLQSIAILLEAMRETMSEESTLRLSTLVGRIPLRDMALRLSGVSAKSVPHSFTEF